MNRITEKGESCKSEDRDFFGELEENPNNRYLVHRHLRTAGWPAKRLVVLSLGHFC
jgi:tRNA splicing endonuclease